MGYNPVTNETICIGMKSGRWHVVFQVCDPQCLCEIVSWYSTLDGVPILLGCPWYLVTRL